MPLETGDFISDLVITNPLGTDPKSQGDDHLRLLKKVIQQTFPDFDRLVRLTAEQMNGLTGMVAAFPVAVTAAEGWLVADGQTVLRATYPDLFALLGVVYGPGDGSTDFVLPDYRGQFLRGLDAGAGVDPDAAGRTDRGDGVTGDAVGTKQNDNVGVHNHPFRWQEGSSNSGGNYVTVSNSNSTHSNTSQLAVQNNTGSESRPVNVNVQYFIHI